MELGVVEQSHQDRVIYSYRDLIEEVLASMESRDEEDVVIGLQDVRSFSVEFPVGIVDEN